MGVANPARVARHVIAVCLLLEGAVASAQADLSKTGGASEQNLEQRTTQVPTASNETRFNDPWASTSKRSGHLACNHSSPTAKSERLTLPASYDTRFYEGHYPNTDGLSWEDSKRRWWSGDVQRQQPLGAGHRLTVGTTYRDNALQPLHLGNKGEPLPHFCEARRSSHWAAYLQDEWRISNPLLVNAGLRHDRYGSFDATTSRRAAVIVNPGPADDRIAFVNIDRPSLTLGIQNLLDRRYCDPDGEGDRRAEVWQAGRDVRRSLRYRC